MRELLTKAIPVLLPAALIVLTWILVRIRAQRRFFARVAGEFSLPVLVYDRRGRLRYLSPGLLIFDKTPPVSILTQSALIAQLSRSDKLVEVDSIIYRCELNSLTDKNRGAYCVATLEFVGRKP